MTKPVHIFCNIDRYKGLFIEIGPDDPIPRAGEMVGVKIANQVQLKKNQLPLFLEVKQVTHGEMAISIELHFTAHQLAVFKQIGVNPFE
jgi:hypothetical protein